MIAFGGEHVPAESFQKALKKIINCSITCFEPDFRNYIQDLSLKMG